MSELLLSIEVGPHRLGLAALGNGTWFGVERNGDETHLFAGAVVNERPLAGSEAWTGFKLSERGDRTVVYGLANGRLEERDPFRPAWSSVGKWSVDRDGLHILSADRSLTMTPWKAGMYLGTEHSHQPDQGYLVVRVEVRPDGRVSP
jgi:hypothetical protein